MYYTVENIYGNVTGKMYGTAAVALEECKIYNATLPFDDCEDYAIVIEHTSAEEWNAYEGEDNTEGVER